MITISPAILIGLAALTLHGTAAAQAKPAGVAKKTADTAVKSVSVRDTSKVITLKARFGPYDGSSPVVVENLKSLAGTKLVVTDNKGTNWTVVAWRFGWNRKEMSNDIRTGKRKWITNYYAVEVLESDTLPTAWQTEIKETLQKGEEISIEQIIAENPKTKEKRLVPPLKFNLL
ncbi:MAG: hypothetical protein MUF24_12830 [Chitinophagaceae bacterium]|jgi:hypothetical protein|nr:hypothetical protein [Chitinophagaceae bacterium]